MKQVLVVTLFIVVLQSANAGVISYFDRTSFEAATSTLTTENFETFNGSFFDSGNIVDLGPFIVTQESTIAIYGRISSFASASIDVNGSIQINAHAGNVPNDTFTMVFDSAITAVGFDTKGINYGNQFLIDGNVVLTTSNPPFDFGNVFVGLISTTPFTTLNYQNLGGGDVFGIDDVSFGNAIGRIPEPTTLALMGLGLVCIGYRRKVK